MKWMGLAAVTAMRLLVWVVGGWQAFGLVVTLLAGDFGHGSLVFAGIKLVVLAVCVGLEVALRRLAARLRSRRPVG